VIASREYTHDDRNSFQEKSLEIANSLISSVSEGQRDNAILTPGL
jgi:hypothetical protein